MQFALTSVPNGYTFVVLFCGKLEKQIQRLLGTREEDYQRTSSTMSRCQLESLRSGDRVKSVLKVLPPGFEGHYGFVFGKGPSFRCLCIHGCVQVTRRLNVHLTSSSPMHSYLLSRSVEIRCGRSTGVNI